MSPVSLLAAAPLLKSGPKSVVTAAPIDWDALGPRDWRRVKAFAETYIKTPKGKGALKPFRLRPWQVEILKGLFPARGARPRSGMVALPRGNGKSTLGALIGLYALVADGVASPQVLLAASDMRQAGIIFGAARRMVELSPDLSARLRVFQDRIVSPLNDGVLLPLPSEFSSLQGWDFSLCLLDELHVVNRDTFEALLLGAGKRQESLLLAISTPPMSAESVMKDLRDLALSDPSPDFYFREWTSDLSHDSGCVHCWKSSNPALGDFLAMDAMISVKRTARESSFRTFRLGQWLGATEDSWVRPEQWAAIADPSRSLTTAERITVGLDGSFAGDSTCLVGCSVDDRSHLEVLGCWESGGNPDYRVPVEEVEDRMRELARTYRVIEFTADPFRWTRSIQILAAEGLPMSEFPQSAQRMTPATVGLGEAIANGLVSHGNDERLTRHVMHSRVREDYKGTRISKESKMSEKKIDLAVASILAWARAQHYATQAPDPVRSRLVRSF